MLTISMPQPRSQSVYFRSAVIFVSLLAILVASRFSVFFRRPLLEQGDLAINAIQIHHAKFFDEIYGNYSRYEFNHPGPAFFYAYAFGERVFHDWLRLTPSPGNAHLLTGAVLQSFFFVAGLMLLRSCVPWRAFMPLALACGALFFGHNRESLTSLWPPHVLALPLFCFLAAGVRVALGHLRHMLWLTLAGGFLFHGHVVMPLFVGVIGMLAVGLGIRQRRREKIGSWKEIWAAHHWVVFSTSALIALFLLPLAIDVATRGSRSNVATIFGRLAANAQEHMGMGQSLLFFFSFPVASREHDRLLTTVEPETWRFVHEHLPGMVGWFGVLVLPPLIAWWMRRRLGPEERRFFFSATAMVVAAVVCCIVWGLAQAGGIRHYNGYFYQGIYFFGGLLGIVLVARQLEPFWRTQMSVAVGALALVTAGYAWRSRPSSAVDRGIPIHDRVTAALTSDFTRQPKLLVFDHNSWHIGAAVALELTRRGIGCYTLPWWSYMFQRRHDAAQLGDELTARTETWWIAPNGPDGISPTSELTFFRDAAPLKPASGAIGFGPGGNGFRYLVAGITDADPDGIPRTNERRVVLSFRPEYTNQDVRVTFDAASENALPRSADVFFSGTAVGKVAVATRAEITVVVPAALWNAQPIATLELRFRDATPQRLPVRPDYERWIAWQLWRIRCESPQIAMAFTVQRENGVMPDS